MKLKIVVFSMITSISLLAGCARQPAPNTQATTTQTATKPDAVSAASITDDPAVFAEAMGKNGTWIICATKDITIDKDLVLEGTFTNGKKDDKGADIIQRKIALYTQDADRKVTNRFTLTAPKLTVTSPNASIQHGTFKGDLYVSVKDFQLVDAIIEGNVYFSSDEVKNTFKMDDASKITGKQEVKK